jgi:hypothetical protein
VRLRVVLPAVIALAVASVGLAAVAGPPETETVLAAGDIGSCTSGNDERTAAIVARHKGTVLALGDLAYERGTADEFKRCYAPSWGRFKHRTRPVPGNHEYVTRDAAPYKAYWGLDRTYYAFDVGTWRLYALDSEDVSAAQLAWLERDLERHPHRCVLAYWHRPLFSSGPHGNQRDVRPFWRLLYQAGADIVLNGHDHDYERFSRLDPDGGWDWFHGIREFVVGTGGKSLYRNINTTPTTRAVQWWTYGVLQLELGQRGYSWSFLPTNREFRDYGGEPCR